MEFLSDGKRISAGTSTTVSVFKETINEPFLCVIGITIIAGSDQDLRDLNSGESLVCTNTNFRNASSFAYREIARSVLSN